MREISRILENIKENIIDILLPRTCVACGKEGKYICEKCGLFLSEAPNVFMAGGLEEVVSAWEYEGLIKNIIFKIKYESMFDAINELVAKAFEIREPYIPEDTTITFVPMFKKKEKRRGFNQAELIAKKVGEITGREVLSLVEKIKDTPSQTKLSKKERIINVKDSFALFRPGLNKSLTKDVLLVDDVWTSGATMQECCRVLKRSGVKKVWGFTLARTV
ncbi:MAG: ComF family protein [Candidatus Pacebacteria bacterium]|nr:ComF family protein [Candidatus Paceibacterota bacterium]